MDDFHYEGGGLRCEEVPLSEIAGAAGTPAYVYSHAALERAYRELDDAFSGMDHLVCYAVKANGNLAVLRALASLGAGADIVSLGEMRRALAAGFTPDRIVFSGVGKTADEITAAVGVGIGHLNIESREELELVGQVAAAEQKRVQSVIDSDCK